MNGINDIDFHPSDPTSKLNNGDKLTFEIFYSVGFTTHMKTSFLGSWGSVPSVQLLMKDQFTLTYVDAS